MPTMQAMTRTTTGITRSRTRPRSFFARTAVASSRAPRSGLPAATSSSNLRIGPKSSFMKASANMVTIVRIA